MIEDIDKYIEILSELQITEHQFLILWLVESKDERNILKYKAVKGDFDTDQILDLIERGYLNDFGLVRDNIQTFNIYDFLVTDLFKSKVMVESDQAVEELVAAYPSWYNIGGKKIPAKNFDYDKLGKLYFTVHKGNRIKHEKIIQITKDYHERITGGYAVNKGGVEDYIRGRVWLLYEQELSDKGGGGDINNKVY